MWKQVFIHGFCLFLILSPPQLSAQQSESGIPKVIAFGSCNNQNQPQPLWEFINAAEPNLWIWLGDNIYADTRDMRALRSMYMKQKINPGYSSLRERTSVMGIWDDHDYGENDGGSEYPKAEESKKLMFEFLDVPKNNPAWKRPGAYQSYTFRDSGAALKVILLDGRTFRSPIKRKDGVYLPNPTGTMLGNEQWEWLEKELSDPSIDLYLVGCGIQFLPEEHKYEKWANFPADRQRLLSLIQEKKPKGILLLSGDRHLAEISCTKVDGLGYPLCEITSSGLTHSWEENQGEANKFRQGKLIKHKNFGLLTLDFSEGDLRSAKIEIRGIEGRIMEEKIFSFGK